MLRRINLLFLILALIGTGAIMCVHMIWLAIVNRPTMLFSQLSLDLLCIPAIFIMLKIFMRSHS